MNILTVAELNQLLKDKVDQFSDFSVKGEIADFVERKNLFFLTLKDETAQIPATMLDSVYKNAKFPMENGISVVVYGSLEYWANRGRVNFRIKRIIKLSDVKQQKVAELIGRLTIEGVLAQQKKLSLAPYPVSVVLIAADKGKAKDDVCQRLQQRWPLCHLSFIYSLVQGKDAPEAIVSAIKEAITLQPQIIIIARGGGSSEDLRAFDDEAVARCIAACPIPIITGIGHESDRSVADLVAFDFGITPTAAVDKAVPDQSIVNSMLNRLDELLSGNFAEYLRQKQRLLDYCQQRYMRLGAMFNRRIMQKSELLSYQRRLKYALSKIFEHRRYILDSYSHQLGSSMTQMWQSKHAKLDILQHRLELLAPTNILKRGFAIVRQNDKIITDASDVIIGQELQINVAYGTIVATAIDKGK